MSFTEETKDERRIERIFIRVNTPEKQNLNALCLKLDMSQSAVVRMALKTLYNEVVLRNRKPTNV